MDLVTRQMRIKLSRIETSYRPLRFETIAELDAQCWDTKDHLRAEPKDVAWRPVARDTTWGGAWMTRWFVSDFTATPACAGRRLFVRARTGAFETMVFVNGKPAGVFDGHVINTPSINHSVVCTCWISSHHLHVDAPDGMIRSQLGSSDVRVGEMTHTRTRISK
ncbi:MAG: hypothetical protein M1457_11475 [bacterium]|nr:hypothetical protein [bacterium]